MSAEPCRALAIRPYRDDDLARCAEIMTLARRYAFYWIEQPLIDATAFHEETAGEVLLVGHIGAHLAGFAGLWTRSSFLHHLYVDPAYHGMGLGTALLDAIALRADRPLSLKCSYWNEAARAFYRRHGFVEDPQPSGTTVLEGPWIWVRRPGWDRW